MTNTGMANTVTMAKNLPRTISPIETGDVNSSWSVFWRVSSAIDRIVSTGIASRKMKLTGDRIYSMPE